MKPQKVVLKSGQPLVHQGLFGTILIVFKKKKGLEVKQIEHIQCPLHKQRTSQGELILNICLINLITPVKMKPNIYLIHSLFCLLQKQNFLLFVDSVKPY